MAAMRRIGLCVIVREALLRVLNSGQYVQHQRLALAGDGCGGKSGNTLTPFGAAAVGCRLSGVHISAFICGQKGNPKRKSDNMGFSYKEQYAVVVICKDEKEQENIYNRLKSEGFKLKVVAV